MKKLHKLTKIGILDDPNPNPIIFGLMAMITFWPSLILIVIGIIIQLTKP